jgi:hypothetical protein
MLVAIVTWISAALVVVGCASLDGKGRRKVVAEADLVGTIRLAEELGERAEDKTFVAAYRFAANMIESVDVQIAPGDGGVPRNESGDFRVALVDEEGKILGEYGIRNPRKLLIERQGMVEVPETLYVARFPFDVDAREIHILDRRGKVLAVTDLLPAFRRFCTGPGSDDRACRRVQLSP